MPATKPTNTCEFATTPADPSDVQFPSALVAPGYSFKDIVPYEELNGFFNRTGEWTAYLKDLVPNLVFTGSADYGRAQIDPETEVNFGTNSTFSRFTDTASELTLTLLHSGAGFSQLVMDRFQALGKFVLGNSSSAQISVTDYSAPASEANQTVTVENETAVALGETRLSASAFQPGLASPHVSGVGTPYAKDTALYSGNMLRARWAGHLQDDGAGQLEVAFEDSYNMSFSAQAGGFLRWALDDFANLAEDCAVHVTITDASDATAAMQFKWDYEPGYTLAAGDKHAYDDTLGQVGLYLRGYSMPIATAGGGTAYSTVDADFGKHWLLVPGTNVSDLDPHIYITIEVYSA